MFPSNNSLIKGPQPQVCSVWLTLLADLRQGQQLRGEGASSPLLSPKGAAWGGPTAKERAGTKGRQAGGWGAGGWRGVFGSDAHKPFHYSLRSSCLPDSGIPSRGIVLEMN